MKLCRVLGSVVASAHHKAYDGRTILVVQPEGPDGQAQGASFIAIDRVQAGAGDRVLVLTEGNGVRQILGKDAGPIRSIIVGIVDAVHAG
jgi:ethanolamine utilization protein EutN